ncbi:hypothetical protein BGP_6155 [Beggiatoa sp. PS]|nr:hypothetical protein BGP_6155 [Beggiatoa sp. PS]
MLSFFDGMMVVGATKFYPPYICRAHLFEPDLTD